MEAGLREAVRGLCARYPESYWQQLDRRRAYPEELVGALTEAGYLACLVPEEYGGGGLGIGEMASRSLRRTEGVQFPLARSYIHTRAAAAMRDRASELYDARAHVGQHVLGLPRSF